MGYAEWDRYELLEEIERLKKEKQDLVLRFCMSGVHFCNICENKNCGDNTNKH